MSLWNCNRSAGPCEYAALSYCWGEEQPQKTVKDNLKKRVAGFSLSELPKTIRDAVEVTRRLKLQYIWVDSLCIIQDDQDDKAQELGAMHRIYECAALLISAAMARDSEKGLFGRAQRAKETYVVQYRCPDGQLGNVLFQNPSENGATFESVHYRGWTMQEHLLSNRILTYGRFGLRWSCRTKSWFDGPWVEGQVDENFTARTSARGEDDLWKRIRHEAGAIESSSLKMKSQSELGLGTVSLSTDEAMMAELNKHWSYTRHYWRPPSIEDYSGYDPPEPIQIIYDWRQLGAGVSEQVSVIRTG